MDTRAFAYAYKHAHWGVLTHILFQEVTQMRRKALDFNLTHIHATESVHCIVWVRCSWSCFHYKWSRPLKFSPTVQSDSFIERFAPQTRHLFVLITDAEA